VCGELVASAALGSPAAPKLSARIGFFRFWRKNPRMSIIFLRNLHYFRWNLAFFRFR
jgi:hypothetical protein